MILEYGEWAPDAREELTGKMTKVDNAFAIPGGYRSLPQFDAILSTTVLGIPFGAFDGEGETGTIYPFLANETDIKVYRSGAWATVSKSAAAYDAVSRWEFAQYGKYVLAASGGDSAADPIQVYDTGTASNFADISGAPYATTISVIRDFVVVGDTYDATDGVRPYRVWWSGYGDHTSWTPDPATQSDFQDLQNESGKVQRIIGGQQGLILCARDAVRMTYEGPPTIFRFDYMNSPDLGTQYPESAIRVGGMVYYFANGGWVGLGPNGEIDRIGDGKVDQYTAELTIGAPANLSAAYDSNRNNILWLFNGDSTDAGAGPDALVFNLITRQWSTYNVHTYSSSLKLGKLYSSKYGTSGLSLPASVLNASVSGIRQMGKNGTTTDAAPELWTAVRQLHNGRRTLVRRVKPLGGQAQGSADITSVSVLSTNDISSTTIPGPTSFVVDTSSDTWVGLSEARYHGALVIYSGLQDMFGVEIVEASPSGKF